MIDAFERVLHRFRRQGGGDALASRLETQARERYALLGHSAGPVLCHDDFQPGNVLAARDAAGELVLTGLIDFANALAGDPLVDLAKALFCSAHEDPRSAAPLLEGYGPLGHPDPEEALWLYTLYHRLTMDLLKAGGGCGPPPAKRVSLRRSSARRVLGQKNRTRPLAAVGGRHHPGVEACNGLLGGLLALQSSQLLKSSRKTSGRGSQTRLAAALIRSSMALAPLELATFRSP